MKKSTVLRIALLVIALVITCGLSFAQNELAKPANFQQHGNNSSGTTVATENIDSVTVTAVMRYWAEPDASSPSDNVFTWTVAPALGTQTAGANTNIATVTFGNAPATGTIQVTEGTPAPASCTGSPVSINVSVINKPTATGGAAPAAQCSAAPAGLSFTVPVTLTSDLPTVTVNYTVKNPDNSTLIGATDIVLAKTATSFNVTLTGASQYGNYTVTINSIKDRVSVKSNVAGTVATPNITLAVNRTPTTGPIYHLPNM